MKIPSRGNCEESQQSLKKKKKEAGFGLFEEKQTGQHKAAQAGEQEQKDTPGPRDTAESRLQACAQRNSAWVRTPFSLKTPKRGPVGSSQG